MRPLLLSALLAACATASAQACGRCMVMSADGLLLPDGDALIIAQKTCEAAEAGKLAADPEGIPLAAMVRRWAAKQQPSGTVHVIALDTGEKCAVSWAAEGPAISLDVSGPSDGALVLTRRTLQTLINRKLSLDEAVLLGIARVDKPSQDLAGATRR